MHVTTLIKIVATIIVLGGIGFLAKSWFFGDSGIDTHRGQLVAINESMEADATQTRAAMIDAFATCATDASQTAPVQVSEYLVEYTIAMADLVDLEQDAFLEQFEARVKPLTQALDEWVDTQDDESQQAYAGVLSYWMANTGDLIACQRGWISE